MQSMDGLSNFVSAVLSGIWASILYIILLWLLQLVLKRRFPEFEFSDTTSLNVIRAAGFLTILYLVVSGSAPPLYVHLIPFLVIILSLMILNAIFVTAFSKMAPKPKSNFPGMLFVIAMIFMHLFRVIALRQIPNGTAPRENTGGKAFRQELKKLGLRSLHDVWLGNPILLKFHHLVLVGDVIVFIVTKNYTGTIYTKNHSGSIYSDVSEGRWKQVLPRWNGVKRLPNPFMEHKRSLAALSDFTGTEVAFLVVSVGPAKFPDGRPEGIVTVPELGKEFAKYPSTPTSPEVEDAWQKLSTRVGFQKGLPDPA